VPPTLPDRSQSQRRLDELAAKHGVPGATAGVLLGGELAVVATGVSRLGSDVPVTPDSLFLIASVTKVWTATLVMQLVDEGLVQLDAPVADQLDGGFRLGDAEVARTVTVAQLLCHTGGFLGDSPEPSFRDDDAVRRTIEGYAELPQLHRPGSLFSYSNAGYNILGGLVESATGVTWDEALRTRLVEPLGLASTASLPEEILVHPHAVGHEPAGPDTLDLRPVTTWLDPRGSGPCGGTLATSAADLLTFAAMHMADGLARDGGRVLSAESARAMREPRIEQPDPSISPAWGWGWAIERLSDPVVIEHGGNTCGQESLLVAVPELGLAVCVLTNGDVQGLVRDSFVSGVLDELAGIQRPRLPAPASDAVDVDPFVGTYDRGSDLRIDVAATGSRLEARFVTSGQVAEQVPSFTTALTYAGGSTFLMTLPSMTEQIAATFLYEDSAGDSPDGPATHLAIGLRVAPRL
jgi:CubicO group peptidase (beta-lactamase class C family)